MTEPGQDRRPDEISALTRVTEDANLSDSLRRIAAAGCAVLDTCSAASVTLIVAGRPITMAATDELATELDQAQYDTGAGPCLTAARQAQIVRIDSIARDDRWPGFKRAAIGREIASSLSVPLIIADEDTYGALNSYADTAGAFDAEDEELATAFATQAAIAVSNVVAYWASFELSRNLQAAMEHRSTIEQAKGGLMAEHRCSPDEAFTMLRRRSQAENRKLRDIAADIVAQVAGGT